MDAVLYIHGKGGSADEAGHYKPLFPGCDVIGVDYKGSTPWEAGREIHKAITELKPGYGKIILIANSISAYYSMNADIETYNRLLTAPSNGMFDREPGKRDRSLPSGERKGRGHCDISFGDGRVIHAWDMVRIDDYLAIERLTALTGDHPKYLGWVPLESVLNQKPSV